MGAGDIESRSELFIMIPVRTEVGRSLSYIVYASYIVYPISSDSMCLSVSEKSARKHMTHMCWLVVI